MYYISSCLRRSRAANAVFGKIGGRSSEDVILQLIHKKCMPALLYGLEACRLRSSELSRLCYQSLLHEIV